MTFKYPLNMFHVILVVTKNHILGAGGWIQDIGVCICHFKRGPRVGRKNPSGLFLKTFPQMHNMPYITPYFLLWLYTCWYKKYGTPPKGTQLFHFEMYSFLIPGEKHVMSNTNNTSDTSGRSNQVGFG